jgi:hypothetical protein
VWTDGRQSSAVGQSYTLSFVQANAVPFLASVLLVLLFLAALWAGGMLELDALLAPYAQPLLRLLGVATADGAPL